jgi:hypothetical protein
MRLNAPRAHLAILRSWCLVHFSGWPLKLIVRRLPMTSPISPHDPAKHAMGALVRVAAARDLEEFLLTWKLHHPLRPEQLHYGGQTARVVRSMMYLGGDVLYELDGIPGIWHEKCVEAV